MAAYYNEIDPDAVAALRQLIVEGVVASGEVDDRSIKDVTALSGGMSRGHIKFCTYPSCTSTGNSCAGVCAHAGGL